MNSRPLVPYFIFPSRRDETNTNPRTINEINKTEIGSDVKILCERKKKPF